MRRAALVRPHLEELDVEPAPRRLPSRLAPRQPPANHAQGCAPHTSAARAPLAVGRARSSERRDVVAAVRRALERLHAALGLDDDVRAANRAGLGTDPQPVLAEILQAVVAVVVGRRREADAGLDVKAFDLIVADDRQEARRAPQVGHVAQRNDQQRQVEDRKRPQEDDGLARDEPVAGKMSSVRDSM